MTQQPGSVHSEIFLEPITVQNGYITPPKGPALGKVLDEAVVKRRLAS